MPSFSSSPKMAALRVLRTKKESPTCKSIYFEKPKGFSFLPGQFLNLYLEIGGKTEVRSYTISSAPEDGEIRVTFRVKGDFTKELFRARKGGRIRALGPLGRFTFDRDKFQKKSVVFIAGGIGIAGFSSALRTIEKKGGPNSALLLYSERNAEDFPLERELSTLKRTRTVLTFTKSPPRGWKGRVGRIDRQALALSLGKKEISKAVFFVCGSDSFVSDIRKSLLALGVGKKRIVSEGFG